MQLRFSTLVARHRLWRDWDASRQRAGKPARPQPPFWETTSEAEDFPTGSAEYISRVYVRAPDNIRVESDDGTWLSVGRHWWQWGGSRPALRGEGDPAGPLELSRVAWALDPEHVSIGWGAPPDGVSERSELLDALYDVPLADALFQPPAIEFRLQDAVLPSPFSSAEEAARRLPFPLLMPALDPAAQLMIVIDLQTPQASVMIGDLPNAVLHERPVTEPIEPAFEERRSDLGEQWFYARTSERGVVVEVESALDEKQTRDLVDSLHPIA